MTYVFRCIAIAFILLLPGLVSAGVTECDIDQDSDIDSADIQLILAVRNQPADGPLDPRDADHDGIITVLDARSCVLICTLPRCVEPPPNNAPLADAGDDQTVVAGDTVKLDGSGSSDSDGDPLLFSWSIAGAPPGSAAQLSDTAAVMPSFVADVEGDYRIELIVNDGKVDSASDEMVITTIPGNRPPVGDPGPDQTVFVGDTVLLDGSGSRDPDLDPLTYSWRLTSVPQGSAASFNDPALVNPSFLVDLPGDYVAELIVADGQTESAPATVTVSTTNSRPVADAGPDRAVTAGEPVRLDGAGSFDTDRDPLTFSWSLTSVPVGSAAALDDRTLPSPWLTTDLPGVYITQLIVNDGKLDSAPDTVVVVARDDSAPTAVLDLRDANGDPVTDGRIPFGEDFTLVGSRSIDSGGGSIERYIWTYLDSGIQAQTDTPTIRASEFVPGQLPLGRHRFGLVVVDDSGNQSLQAILSVIVVDTVAPTAVLDLRDANGDPVTDGRIPFGEDFTLAGSRSIDSGGGSIERYIWTYLDSGIQAQTDTPTIRASEFVPGQLPLGRHRFGLVVVDDSGNQSLQAILSVIVVDTVAPTAVLDLRDADGRPVTDGRIPFGEDFTLVGSRSIDSGGGSIERYIWTYLDSGIQAQTDTPTIRASEFVPGQLPLGRHRFGLVVVDDSGNQSLQAILSVIVVDVAAPTAVLDLRDADGRPVTDGRIPFGEDFTLVGSRSIDSGGGSIERYIWTYLDSGIQAQTDTPTIRAAAFLPLPLPVGQQRFGLVVVDDSGNQSLQAILTVIIVDVAAPTAVLDLRDADGRPVTDGRIPFGEDFILDGARSADAGGGSIARYLWTYLDAGIGAQTSASSIRATDLLPAAPPVGEHRFELVVEDDSGNRSKPVVAVVTVK